MSKQKSITSILTKTAENWPESNQNISPEILKIHRIHQHLQQNLTKVVERYGLQSADFSALETLRKEPPPHCLSATALSHSMLFSSGGLTKLLNRITNAGFIERVDNPQDKRGKLVQLTEKGKSLIGKVIVELHQQEQEKMAFLSKNEKTALNVLLNKILGEWE
ncbi:MULTISPECIES: MarR family winged helix-turn-helix transcriptional regulator [Shewanella]|jgi:DNA-binding MarR family transcriptional regulator|uniref:MarR family transcriptional regulator n=1 Tax=Shewanella psychromarinicola TaxID=2487742 RepID=A0A3N4ECJ2_9GAMM|nr:MarR family transcriptional regulator [Shewanella psychromarinicola]AZG36763.1 MarR family transcriptional regulator [Shewanella psychromarinicola]MCL1081967.1 MarR family transcriptional regulator [Shewanella psychromarinicola]RPA34617.1 MarR family transcriptional regulator [Shewanella psychromarinicola]